MSSTPHILLYVSDDIAHLSAFETDFNRSFAVRTASSTREAHDILQREPIQVLLANALLKHEGGAIAFLQDTARTYPKVGRAIIGDGPDTTFIAPAVNKAHVQLCIVRPYDVAEVRQQLESLFKQRSALEAAFTQTGNESEEELKSQLTKAKIDLGSAYQELKATQYQLIVSEKMAALGQLVANVGHEINTPVTAIKSSSQTLAKLLKPLVNDMPPLVRQIGDENAKLFHELMATAAANENSLTTREERIFRRQLEERFTQEGVENAEDLAKSFVEMQLVDGMEQFAPLFALPQAQAIVSCVKYVAQLKGALVNINVAAEKTTKIIMALKSYSYVSKDDKFEPVILDQNVQAILTIYHNLLKHGVQVVKNYQEVPPVPGIPDQLGQVWANLIHNAIQAMRGSGTLSIDLKLEEPYVAVFITDSGPGIPQEIVNRIFEPFFTTKEHGEGSGLGLDICRRIVERHRGKISVESEPGRTTFKVLLPLEQPEMI